MIYPIQDRVAKCGKARRRVPIPHTVLLAPRQAASLGSLVANAPEDRPGSVQPLPRTDWMAQARAVHQQPEVTVRQPHNMDAVTGSTVAAAGSGVRCGAAKSCSCCAGNPRSLNDEQTLPPLQRSERPPAA